MMLRIVTDTDLQALLDAAPSLELLETRDTQDREDVAFAKLIKAGLEAAERISATQDIVTFVSALSEAGLTAVGQALDAALETENIPQDDHLAVAGIVAALGRMP